MAKQKVIVSLPIDLLHEVRNMASDEGVSLSSFITLLLQREVESRRQYQLARDRQRSLMRKGRSLDMQGRVTWKREELHER